MKNRISYDTSGYTELVFGLFDLLGLKFSPRIRDLGKQRLFRTDSVSRIGQTRALLKERIKKEKIIENWDDIKRLVASIKFGKVPASLIISKLQSAGSENSLAVALKEVGRLQKSIFIPEYLCSESKQRRVSAQLNKGEALHEQGIQFENNVINHLSPCRYGHINRYRKFEFDVIEENKLKGLRPPMPFRSKKYPV